MTLHVHHVPGSYPHAACPCVPVPAPPARAGPWCQGGGLGMGPGLLCRENRSDGRLEAHGAGAVVPGTGMARSRCRLGHGALVLSYCAKWRMEIRDVPIGSPIATD